MMKHTFLSAVWTALALLVVAAAGPVSTAHAQDNAARSAGAVVVTGASSGIGRRITERLSDKGLTVFAGARKQADIDALNALENVIAVRLDVTVQAEIDAAVETVEASGQRLLGIVNNAGVANVGPLIEIEEADLDFLFDVNVYGPYRVTKAFSRLLIDDKGRVVNISSISGILSGSLFGVYSMSKHALEAYTDSLAAEMSRFGVAVVAVEPGNYSSAIGRNMLDRMRADGRTWSESAYADDIERMVSVFSNYEESGDWNPEPDDVAAAVEDALLSSTPKAHYMVVPIQDQAEITIKKAIEELVRYNEGQRFTYSRDELVQMLDEELTRSADGE